MIYFYDIPKLMGAGDSELDKVVRTLKGRRAISQAPQVAREFASAQWLSDEETARLCIIVEEWVANLFDHGGLKERDTVELVLETTKEGVRIKVGDKGTPFDPRHLPLNLDNPEPSSGAGAGIGIMRAWAELEGYDIAPEGNELTLLVPVTWGE